MYILPFLIAKTKFLPISIGSEVNPDPLFFYQFIRKIYISVEFSCFLPIFVNTKIKFSIYLSVVFKSVVNEIEYKMENYIGH